eukprot:856045-Karenia_brevis.AAC.1
MGAGPTTPPLGLPMPWGGDFDWPTMTLHQSSYEWGYCWLIVAPRLRWAQPHGHVIGGSVVGLFFFIASYMMIL